VRNFVPAYLVKISNSVYEIIDNKDDICFASVSFDGDDGLIQLWGMVLKFSYDDFLEFCKDQCLFYDGGNKRINGINHEVTPNCTGLQLEVAKVMDKSARKVMKRIKSKSEVVTLGDVVQVPLVKRDWAKIGNLTGVVVNINSAFGVCQVAVKSDALRSWYVYHKVRVVPGAGNNQSLMNLDEAFKGWKGMSVIAPRTAAIDKSIVGGQGIFQCKCKGTCNTNQCLCFKNFRTCTSACHCNSNCCLNHDQEKLDVRKTKVGDTQENPPTKHMRTCRTAD
jgi:hypothetical protein